MKYKHRLQCFTYYKLMHEWMMLKFMKFNAIKEAKHLGCYMAGGGTWGWAVNAPGAGSRCACRLCFCSICCLKKGENGLGKFSRVPDANLVTHE
jgi:hypothetical protein